MSRILCLSRALFCTNCKYSVQNLTLSVPLFTSRAMSRKQRSTHRRPTLTFRNNRHAVLWIFGLGAGFIIALGLKYRDSERSVCEEQKTAESVSKYLSAIENSRDLLQRTKDEVGAPGMVIGVSVDGCEVWCEGLGYADLENRVACGPDTVMRIASISKPLTTAAVARLWENEVLDLDAPVQDYVPEFPHKQFEGEDVTITPRMLLSHLSGIRHYEKDGNKVREDKEKDKGPSQTTEKKAKVSAEKQLSGTEESGSKNQVVTAGRRKKEFEQKEYYLKESFENVIQALELFKDDPLIFKPGSTFLYSTHAFTLLSAVVERAAGQRFLDHMMQMFRELGMLHTVPDENEPLIYKRSRFYHVNKKGRIVNCPYVDNSYKWAGGGFLSTVNDLLVFGNALLYSYQIAGQKNTVKLLPGFLKPQTARSMWAPVDKTEASWDKDGMYAQGWLVVEKQQKYGQCRKRRHYVSHTGGAVGASSVLLVLPRESGLQKQKPSPPHGVVVTILTNLQSVGLNTTALKIALEFDKVKDE